MKQRHIDRKTNKKIIKQEKTGELKEHHKIKQKGDWNFGMEIYF